MADSDRVSVFNNLPPVMWAATAAAFVALAIMLHAVFPRYEYQLVNRPGEIDIVVYDRWSGQFQKGVYADGGNLDAKAIWRPF